MNYYYRIGESFVHYIDDKYNIDLGEAYRLQKNFDTFLENLRKEPSHQISQKLSKGNNASLPNHAALLLGLSFYITGIKLSMMVWLTQRLKIR